MMINIHANREASASKVGGNPVLSIVLIQAIKVKRLSKALKYDIQERVEYHRGETPLVAIAFREVPSIVL